MGVRSPQRWVQQGTLGSLKEKGTLKSPSGVRGGGGEGPEAPVSSRRWGGPQERAPSRVGAQGDWGGGGAQ